MFFPKSDFQTKKGPLPGCWSQSSGVGMHQKPHFPLKPVNKLKSPKIRVRSTIAIPESAFVIFIPDSLGLAIVFRQHFVIGLRAFSPCCCGS